MPSTHLDRLFPNKAFADVLLFFLMRPKEETYLARIVRATGKVIIQVQRALKRLEETGLVIKIMRGNKAYYQANTGHAVFKDLKKVMLQTVIYSDPIQREMSVIKDKIIYGFVFGSMACHSDISTSDIDIFLIGNLTFEEAGNLSYPLSMELGREVNTVIYTLSDFRKKIKAQHTFVNEVIQNPKLWLFGDEQEFEKICRR